MSFLAEMEQEGSHCGQVGCHKKTGGYSRWFLSSLSAFLSATFPSQLLRSHSNNNSDKLNSLYIFQIVGDPSHHFWFLMGYILIYLSTCTNPIIYVLMSTEYRQAYCNLLTCHNSNTTGGIKWESAFKYLYIYYHFNIHLFMHIPTFLCLGQWKIESSVYRNQNLKFYTNFHIL